jgi:hypothetical protein
MRFLVHGRLNWGMNWKGRPYWYRCGFVAKRERQPATAGRRDTADEIVYFLSRFTKMRFFWSKLSGESTEGSFATFLTGTEATADEDRNRKRKSEGKDNIFIINTLI